MKYQYATQDEIPEPLRNEYEEVEGTFRLKIEGLPEGFEISDTRGLLSALKKERENARDHGKLAARVDDLAAQNTKLLSSLNEQRLTNAVTESVIEAKGNLSLLRPLLKQRVKVDDDGKVSVVDEAGQPLLDKEGKEVDVRSFIFALREMPQYQGAFAGSGHSGGGSPPSSRGNGVPPITPSTRRGTMSIKERASFIREHGQDEYFKLPV